MNVHLLYAWCFCFSQKKSEQRIAHQRPVPGDEEMYAGHAKFGDLYSYGGYAGSNSSSTLNAKGGNMYDHVRWKCSTKTFE